MSDPRDLIIEPIVSEKSYALLERNVYTFRVHPDATKPQIHDAVEAKGLQNHLEVDIARLEREKAMLGAEIQALHNRVNEALMRISHLEGANADESGVVTPGNLSYRPNGCVHTVTTKNGATALAFVWGRTEMV